MNTKTTIAIIGAGLAGVEAAFSLREFGFCGSIVLIGREPYPPYDRPPLSKAYLKGLLPRERIWLRPMTSYVQQGIELRLGAQVTTVDRELRHIHLAGGEILSYDQLLLCTGGEPRRLSIPGSDLEGVVELKTLDDAELLRNRLHAGTSVVVIGGGYVGMEFAATARQAGCSVAVLESQQRILSRTLPTIISQHLQQIHEMHGVQVLTGVSIECIEGDSQVRCVVLSDGTKLPADTVLVGIGNRASDDLAHAMGLITESGVVVDAQCRTSDPRVFAAGDCAVSAHEGFATLLRLESIQNAASRARTAAGAMADYQSQSDHSAETQEVPWFWSDQFDVKLQMVGLPLAGDKEILRGDPASGKFSVIFQNKKRMTAIHCVNSAADFAAAKKMIAERRVFDPSLLCDPSISLRGIRMAQARDR
jgi:3-phenylpropionate/trans-cinnamate dioxygenase ferredoxin reductase subunit